MSIEKLEETIKWAKNNIEFSSDKDNPYYSEALEYKAKGTHYGLVLAHQIITGVRK